MAILSFLASYLSLDQEILKYVNVNFLEPSLKKRP